MKQLIILHIIKIRIGLFMRNSFDETISQVLSTSFMQTR